LSRRQAVPVASLDGIRYMGKKAQNIGNYSFSNRKITPVRVARFIFRRLIKVFYDTSIDYLMEKDLLVGDAITSNNPGITWRMAGPDDLPEFGKFLPSFFIRCFKKRFALGEHCLVAICDGRIAHYCWYIWEKNYYVREIIFLVMVLPDKAYIYDAYTRASFRDQGIHQEAYRLISHEMAQAGKRYVVVMMDRKNLNSIFTAIQVGFRLKGSIIYRRILWKKKTRFEVSTETESNE